MTCADCFHSEENHLESGVCNGSLTCVCPKYRPNELIEFAIEIEKIKLIHRSIYARCKYILEKIPTTRNAHEKSFAKIYKEIWYGFKIRKEGTKLTTEEWKRMPHDDSISRQRRQVVEDHPELGTYDKNMVSHKEAKFQAMLELATET